LDEGDGYLTQIKKQLTALFVTASPLAEHLNASGPSNVRFGLITDIEALPSHVRFTPESGHR